MKNLFWETCGLSPDVPDPLLQRIMPLQPPRDKKARKGFESDAKKREELVLSLAAFCLKRELRCETHS
jgi:hypothetical protein